MIEMHDIINNVIADTVNDCLEEVKQDMIVELDSVIGHARITTLTNKDEAKRRRAYAINDIASHLREKFIETIESHKLERGTPVFYKPKNETRDTSEEE